MTTWTSDELDKVGKAEELQIESCHSDGTLRKPVTIWVVRDGDALYVRAVKGRSGPWFRGVQDQHQGRIKAGGVSKDVTFVEAEADQKINNQIDAAYRSKYKRYSDNIVNSVLTPQARAATIQLVPR